MSGEPFLQPRLTGDRFQGGVIPLEVLADLSVLAELFAEVAKWRFLQDNPTRKRLPRGFSEKITLKLAGVEEGSAKPVILLVAAATGSLFPPTDQGYFVEARTAIIEAIAAAGEGTPITGHLPKRFLGYFDRLGRNLKPGEAMEFTEGRRGAPARLTKETRHKLVLASEAEEVTNEIAVFGTVPEMDQQANTFQIQLFDGTKVKAPLGRPHFETVMEAFAGYKQGVRVRMQVAGLFNWTNKLQSIEVVEHISILDPLDIEARIEELKVLKSGWLDGLGLAPSPAHLDWFASEFNRGFPDDLPLPRLYPTAEGHVRAEWSLEDHELSLEVALAERLGYWHGLRLSDDVEREERLDLTRRDSWIQIAALVRDAVENA